MFRPRADLARVRSLARPFRLEPSGQSSCIQAKYQETDLGSDRDSLAMNETSHLLDHALAVVYLCLSSSSDDHLLSPSSLGTGMRFGTQNKFCNYRASLVHSVSLIVS